DRLVEIDHPGDPAAGTGNSRRRHRAITLLLDPFIPVVTGPGRELGFDFVRPRVLSWGLIEVAVDDDGSGGHQEEVQSSEFRVPSSEFASPASVWAPSFAVGSINSELGTRNSEQFDDHFRARRAPEGSARCESTRAHPETHDPSPTTRQHGSGPPRDES